MVLTIVITGTGGVGKSALTLAYVNHQFVSEYGTLAPTTMSTLPEIEKMENDPTIEDSHRKQVLVDGIATMLDILDTAGQEEFKVQKVLRQVAWRGQGFVLVYSIAERKSLDVVEELRAKILRIKDANAVPMVLVGNKSDLPDSQREVTSAQGKELAAKFGCPFFESSAKLRTNVDELFVELVRQVRRHQQAKAEGDEVKKSPKGKKNCSLF